jgi:hypothetical protein
MRNSNGVTSMTGRMSRRGLGIAVAGAAAMVLASGGIAMASPLPRHGAPGATSTRPSWNRISNNPGTSGAGNGKSGRPAAPTSAPVQGQPGWNRISNNPGTSGAGNGKSGRAAAPTSAPVQGQPGWNRVSNLPGTSGAGNGKGGLGLPGSTPVPAPVTTSGQGGLGGLAPGSTPAPAPFQIGGQGGLAPGSTPAPLPTGGLGGEA